MTDAEKAAVQEIIRRQNVVEELALKAQKNLIINTLLKLEKEVLTSSDDISFDAKIVKVAKADALEEAVRRIKKLGDEVNGSDKQSKVENVC